METGATQHDEERARKLGYRPQNELAYNRLLPYADRIDEESERLLKRIKAAFAKAVLLKELKPGCAIWNAWLVKYIKLYGLKFSKQCHIELIQLVYELIILPDLEPTQLRKFCALLILLTKRTHLISPEELTLQWRPLYEVGRRVFSKSTAVLGMYHYPPQKRGSDGDNDVDDHKRALSSVHQLLQYLESMMKFQEDDTTTKNETLESTFGIMVQNVRTYFPPSSTREILDELLPKFLPWYDYTKNQEIIQDLALFLPHQTLPQYMNQGFKLWLDDFMLLWKTCHNIPLWEPDMMNLMAFVAQANIGHIDWELHYKFMFTKFLRSFNLPVFYKEVQNNRQQNIDIHSMSMWIVAVLGPNSSAQNYLDNFMTTVATYLHSANAGRWSGKLRELLKRLPSQFVNRVHKERTSYKTTWEPKSPETHLLTDNDITRFVECMLNVVLQAVFSRSGAGDACTALQHLALLRPSIVIPPVIEKMWNTLQSLTEPHKLTSAIQCVVAVARPLASGFDNGYPEGPTHIIPLLLSCLPGLDPNDFKKTLVTLHFISVFANVIPFVDCSGASLHWTDLSEEEHTVCEATAQFEDFVLEYFDKLFVLIESNSIEFIRMEREEAEPIRSKLETTIEGAFTSTSISILGQTSSNIFKLALKKSFNFVTQRVFEVNVAGQMAASLCRGFSRVNAHETLKLFIPHLYETINTIIGDNEAILKEENLDKELLYNLLLLSHIVEKNGQHLLPYMPKIFSLLDKVLKITSIEGYTFVCTTIRHMIMSFCTVYPEKCRSSTGNYDADIKEFLAVREWGKPGNIWKNDLNWHIPSDQEIKCVESIIHKYLIPELKALNSYVAGDLLMTKEELNKSLSIIRALLSANNLMPNFDNTAFKLVDSLVPLENFKVEIGISHEIHMPDGSNIRYAVSTTMHALQNKLLNSREDDTKSLCKLISIWELLVTHNSYSVGLFETHSKVFNAFKKTLEDKLTGRPAHLRVLLSERTLLLHELRIQGILSPLTVFQANCMIDLFKLATSRYSEVRMYSQSRLNWIVSNFAYSFKVIVPFLVECLRADPIEEHERLKGALYCLLGPRQTPIIAKHDWNVVGVLWPGLIYSTPSEKPSVIKLFDSLVRSIGAHFPTITMSVNWSESCLNMARNMLTQDELSDPTFLSLYEQREEIVQKINKENLEAYHKLLDTVVDGAQCTQMHWRHVMMCVNMIPYLVHLDVKYTPKAVKLILKCLIDDNINVRKLAVKLMVFILKQRKRSHKKISIDSHKFSGITSDEENRKLIPGFRPDNMWLQYDNNIEYNKEKWDNQPYNHKDCYGFYYWPKQIPMYAPLTEQPEYGSINEFDEAQKEIYDFFMKKENVDKLINYFSIEDKKGRDKFNTFRFIMYKGLFSTYVDAFLPTFIDHLKTLVMSKLESLQRCAAEIIAGLIRSTKHWPYDKVESLRNELVPLLNIVFDNMTTETYNDWGACITNVFDAMDVSRLGWLLKVLEKGMDDNGSSARLCGRLYLLQAAFLQHQWTLSLYSNSLLEKIKDKGMLAHPYQNVRYRVSSILCGLLEKDIVYPGGVQNVAPSISKLLDEIAPQVDKLYKEGLNGITSSSNNFSISQSVSFLAKLDNTDNDSNSVLHQSFVLTNDKLKSIIQDSIYQSGVEKNNINISAVNKLIQNVKKSSSHQDDSVQDFDSGSNSPLENFILNAQFLDNNENRPENTPFMELLEERLSSVLKISDDKLESCALQLGQDSQSDTKNGINLKLFKTVLKGITSVIYKNPCGVQACFYTLFPAACTLESREGDEEIYLLCATFLSILAESMHDSNLLSVAFNTIQKTCQTSSRCARISCISFMQSLIFHNMSFITNGPLLPIIKQITLELMSDVSPEVREAAAAMFAGLLHCNVLTDIQELIDHFKSLCKEGKIKRGPIKQETLARRHCGVLGLCAFIAAHPYTVPSYLPEIFLLLDRHLNDPLIIQSTIRKTLGDFKRTHHDDWQTHQLKFTQEELTLLSDISVPPSYYV